MLVTVGRSPRTAELDGQGGWTQRRFIWGGEADWQCLEERDTSGDLVARYTYAPGYIDAVAVQERDLNSDTDFADTNELVYYHQNTLFSVMALTDANGSVVERYRYDAYGACTVLDPDGSADADGLSDVENPYTFTGRRLDDESGLMQYRHRWYSPTVGRFISGDPQEYLETFNLYEYCRSRPSVLVDPTGEGVLVVGGAALLIGGAVSGAVLGGYRAIQCMRCERRVMKTIAEARKHMDPCDFQEWQRTSGILLTCVEICGHALESYMEEIGPGTAPPGVK